MLFRSDALSELIVHGETGLLVPPEDVNALADAIDRLLANRIFASDLGERARARAAQAYPIGRMVDSTIGVYAEIAKASHRL